MLNDLGRVGVVVAARTGSTRLPGKVLRELGGQPMILFLLNRLSASKYANNLLLATTDLPGDDKLSDIVKKAGYSVFRGSQDDVVRRFVDAASLYNFDHVVRVTGDCPFVDFETLDFCIQQAQVSSPFDLATTKGRFPIGIDYEIYSSETMRFLNQSGRLDNDDREHLTLYFYRHLSNFRIAALEPLLNWHSVNSYTVDTEEDFMRAKELVHTLGSNDFSIDSLINAEK